MYGLGTSNLVSEPGVATKEDCESTVRYDRDTSELIFVMVF